MIKEIVFMDFIIVYLRLNFFLNQMIDVICNDCLKII